MLKEMLENVRSLSPVIHNITNYVTVNDCANILLACGASPIMSDDIGEVAEITSICSGLCINIGTLNAATIPSMFLAGKTAESKGKAILLDPVGAGASRLRTETAQKLLDEVHFTVVRGNASEIKALATGMGGARGVDVDTSDILSGDMIGKTAQTAKEFARKYATVVVVTGAVDIVTDGNKVALIRNGMPLMSKITGTGCMLSAVTTAYISANLSNPMTAATAAVCAVGLCGQRAASRLTPENGNATYRNYIIDEVFNLNGERLEDGADYEIL